MIKFHSAQVSEVSHLRLNGLNLALDDLSSSGTKYKQRAHLKTPQSAPNICYLFFVGCSCLAIDTEVLDVKITRYINKCASYTSTKISCHLLDRITCTTASFAIKVLLKEYLKMKSARLWKSKA